MSKESVTLTINSEYETITRQVGEHIELAKVVREKLSDAIAKGGEVLYRSIAAGGRIYWAGNGGSAADSQHLAAELLGRFKRERRAIGSAALTTDSSVLTAIGNDYGFEDVFSRQVEGLIESKDVLVAISTSGNSKNLLAALDMAARRNAFTLGLLGRDGGAMRDKCSLAIVVPSGDTARIQEMHIMIGHILCDIVERRVCEEKGE